MLESRAPENAEVVAHRGGETFAIDADQAPVLGLIGAAPVAGQRP